MEVEEFEPSSILGMLEEIAKESLSMPNVSRCLDYAEEMPGGLEAGGLEEDLEEFEAMLAATSHEGEVEDEPPKDLQKKR